ncbi:MAG: hypothetical protein RRZ85_08245 [Gordonibacter sp.]|uniref:cyanophycin synthetase family protein n=1 Tax=Gordonibacter sp. TaxID=1968902 RepID=UPI002FCBD3B5
MVALAIERLTVMDDRISCVVALAPGTPHFTTPDLAARVVASFPDLPRHACVNEVGDTFGAVMNRTSLPHLLEHLVIDLQTRVAPVDSAATFVGTTVWTDETAGRARIEVNFTDDLVALRAFRDAAHFLSGAVVP